MTIDINECDLNEDYFHFTNAANVNSILKNGLVPQVGVASQLVNDRPNVSISQGGKGIMGTISSFIHEFGSELEISDIPEEYRKYFPEITDFNQEGKIGKVLACRAMKRKLTDEVYFRVIPTEEQLEDARKGGLTGFDINLPIGISKDQLAVITGPDNRVLSALEVAYFVFEKAKNIAVLRDWHSEFFEMFELEDEQLQAVQADRIATAKNRVFYSDGLGVGRDNPVSLHTSPSLIYRVTGMDQLADIVNCGFVRPREGRVKGGHVNEVFWSVGGNKTFYYDKRPVIETLEDRVKDGQIGTLSLDDLSAIWVFDYEKNCYTDKLDFIKQVREKIKNSGINISGEQIKQMLIGGQIEDTQQNVDDIPVSKAK